MLKEGWDVTNLYTIVPLRAANARTLIEQSIGRGLRLPYGKRTGVAAVDRLNIVAHDKFQEIVDEANQPIPRSGCSDRARSGRAGAEDGDRRLAAEHRNDARDPAGAPLATTEVAGRQPRPGLRDAGGAEGRARSPTTAIQKLAAQPGPVPSIAYVEKPEVQARDRQGGRGASTSRRNSDWRVSAPASDIAAVVAKTAALVVDADDRHPAHPGRARGRGAVRLQAVHAGPGHAQLSSPVGRALGPAPADRRAGNVGLGDGGIEETRLEDYVVSGLIDFDDVSYDDHADLLYDLAGQTVRHLSAICPRTTRARSCASTSGRSRGSSTPDAGALLGGGGRLRGEGEQRVLRRSSRAPTPSPSPTDRTFAVSPADKCNMAKYLFGGFERCLHPVQKFQSDAERKLAVILDRDARKWFKPAKGQFQIFYRLGRRLP